MTATVPSSEPGAATSASRNAWGFGLASVSGVGAILEVWYPAPHLGGAPPDAAPPDLLGKAEHLDERRGVHTRLVRAEIDLDAAPGDVADAYLRLHLLSHRLIKPHEANLDGIFSVLSNVAWTNLGPFAAEGFEDQRLRLRADGTRLQVYGVDKFPRMTDYVVPSGVRIADADRVRLGAHLAPGTTVMHEGFCNFNAGTLGPSMVEGRISQGVVVGESSDIGGGASIMGTLSGGGTEVIRVGRDCLIGANAGIGISLGDGCIVEAGCYITAGTRVTLPNGEVRKALELSGASGILYRRNSISGAVEALERSSTSWVSGLNAVLHRN